MSDILEPCPVCGSRDITVNVSYGFVPSGLTMFLCGECGLTASFQGKKTRGAAIATWNNRYEPKEKTQ